MSKKPFIPYEWPEALYPLRQWLQGHAVDVAALKSQRQVLFLAKTLGKQGKKMPNRSEDYFPHLLKIQRTLCPKGMKQEKRERYTKPEKWIPGTFGAASPVRHIDPSEYEVVR